jgi:hypothetical protein
VGGDERCLTTGAAGQSHGRKSRTNRIRHNGLGRRSIGPATRSCGFAGSRVRGATRSRATSAKPTICAPEHAVTLVTRASFSPQCGSVAAFCA